MSKIQQTDIKRKKELNNKIKKLKKEKNSGVDKNKLSEINSKLFDLEAELRELKEPGN